MENQAAVAVPQKQPGRVNLFSIKPYGNNLCTPGAKYWIVCIRLVIVVMALAEAIAWGYLGSLFGRGPVGYIAAGIAFLFVFLIIWIIDVSFVTLDMSKAHYDNKIMKKEETSSWLDTLKISIGLLGRVAIVVVSLSISAPFIAQIVFMQDIDNEMESRNLARVASVSDSLLAQKDLEIAQLDTLILEKENELITETAGKGESGNYGFGPVTQAMERNIQRLKDERATTIEEREEMGDAFAQLSIDEFAARYNVDLVNNGVQARAAILNSLTQNPEYKTAKRAITAFLAFIFAALVLLKLFQPRSVRIYFNEKLQDLYREYLAGTLNKWIAKEEQVTENGEPRMSPLRFEDWSVNTYGVVRNEDIHRRESSKNYNAFRLKIDQLEDEKQEVKKMLEPVEQEYEERITELNMLRVALMQATTDYETNTRSIKDLGAQLKGIDSDLRNGNYSGQDLLHAVQAKKNTETRLAELREATFQLKNDQDLASHRYEAKQEEVGQVEELIARIRANFRRIQDHIDQERIKFTDLIVSGKALNGSTLLNEPVEEIEDREEDADEINDQLRSDQQEVQDHENVDEQVARHQRNGIYEAKDPFEDEEPANERKSDAEMVNQFIWDDEDDAEEQRKTTRPGYQAEFEANYSEYPDSKTEDEEDDEEVLNVYPEFEDEYYEEDDLEEQRLEEDGHGFAEPQQRTAYPHYPLLTSGIREEEAEPEESPIKYVDDNQLKKYADSVSMAAYENDEAENDKDREDKENIKQNEERKSDNFKEVFSPHDVDVAPEEMDPRVHQRYSEEVDGPQYYWDEMETDTTDLPVDNHERKRTTYAWDALEFTEPDHTETERDEPVEESAEEEDQSPNTADTGEAETTEGGPDNNGSEASNKRTQRPTARRKLNSRRRLGTTGDWMIG